MTVTKKDLAIFDKFGFDTPPVAVKFSARCPDAVDRLGEKIALCQMLKKAQEGNAFYADAENHYCEAGMYVLGMAGVPAPFRSGEYGAGLRIFNGPRAASRLYLHIPTIDKDVVNYVAFSPLDKLNFEPDLLIILSRASQTEILLRALTYGTGGIWTSKASSAIGCAWIYVYPYLTGELNYIVTGLGHGIKRRNLFPEDRQIITIPSDLFPAMLQSLREMAWVLPAYKPDGFEFVRKLLADLGVSPPE
jgi:uncharacterized protein (DUF169 family)